MADSKNFIEQIIDEELKEGGRVYGKKIHTRFPPEPNGYLHIGHAKALEIDFGTAEEYNGLCNLRMDDTNPTKEDEEFVEAIKEDIHWLGHDWDDRFFYASEYFEKMYEFAIELINKGLAYVCELTPDQMRDMRGDTKTPAVSPYRDRPIEESLDLFKRMRAGEFEDGKMTLRAKIDLASGNFNMRDPVIYEFESHRPLYDWVVNNISVECKPRQIEFARLGITHTVLSKRKLRAMIEAGIVTGWDDPRMPTLCGLRRRGYTPASIHNFSARNGVAKVNSVVDFAFLEYCLREDLNEHAQRAMAVLKPIKLIIDNYPEGTSEEFDVENNPKDENAGMRKVTFSRELWIESEDFMEVPAPKYFRLFPGNENEVRLKSAYVVKCVSCDHDADGNVTAVHCTYDPDSRGGNTADGRKIKSTIHWVDANNCVDGEIRLYDRLFTTEQPDLADCNYLDFINPDSLEVIKGAKLEKFLENTQPEDRFQFLRTGYFCADSKDSSPEHLVFNRAVSLKDSYKPE